MTPQEKNDYQLELVKLKSRFIAIGITQMPTKTINELMPEGLTGVEAIDWGKKASYVWNNRASDFETYLPIFEQAYEILKDTEKVA